MRVNFASIGLFMGLVSLQSYGNPDVSNPKDVGLTRLEGGMTFVTIPAGTFTMGSPDSEPGRGTMEDQQHKVTISKAFEMQTTEVTQSQWVAAMASNPSYFQKTEHCPSEFTQVNGVSICLNNPVDTVSWNDAQEFIGKLNAKADGYHYRLPTEAEWEYSARAGTTGSYAGDLDAIAWYSDNSGQMTHPVSEKSANAWGLFDMHGNVWEWTADRWGSYSAIAVTDPEGPSSGPYRVFRGGDWGSLSRFCRSANRDGELPEIRRGYSTGYLSYYLGFRLVRTKI
jgi:formylglycine-generating enzyme required for sulfatase activity